jgi:hypothetical protein
MTQLPDTQSNEPLPSAPGGLSTKAGKGFGVLQAAGGVAHLVGGAVMLPIEPVTGGALIASGVVNTAAATANLNNAIQGARVRTHLEKEQVRRAATAEPNATKR